MSLQTWQWRDGAFVSTAAIDPADRGFRYGMAVFETIALRRGIPLHLDAHLDRLRAACSCCAFAPPQEAFAGAGPILRRSGVTGIARIYVTAGPGSFDAPADAPALVVLAESREPLPRDCYETGYRLFAGGTAILPVFPGLKTANYWANIHALATARREHCDEALLQNPDGELVSAAMANLFLVRENQLLTPAAASGARPGVIREWVMQRRAVSESVLRPADLWDAGEIFLTSSGLGVMPVGRLGDKPLHRRETAHELGIEYERFIETAAGAAP